MYEMPLHKKNISKEVCELELITSNICIGFCTDKGAEEDIDKNRGPACYYPESDKFYLVPTGGKGFVAELRTIEWKPETQEEFEKDLKAILEENRSKINVSPMIEEHCYMIPKRILHQSKGIGPLVWFAGPNFKLKETAFEVKDCNLFDYAGK